MTHKRNSGIANSSPAQQSCDSATPVVLATADPDGVIQATATSTSEMVLTSTDYDGALVDGDGFTGSAARNVTVTTGANVGSYVIGSEIVVTGSHPTYDGVLSETLVVGDADGDETLTTASCFKAGAPITITLDAQADTSGSIEVGVGLAVSVEPPARWLWANAAGDLYVHLASDGNTITKVVAAGVGPLPFEVDAIHGGSTLLDLAFIR